eukprot:TRINITY_DN5336_c1_g3_i1.p1 TRINITY_DN5336_c1_g3~~TRINITY_DN5336_c1_g3_i1.p1  ORF type:complete len:447 (+),score=19.64 TRINITY_DN5336_c1_g3_i1:386-1726(+)
MLQQLTRSFFLSYSYMNLNYKIKQRKKFYILCTNSLNQGLRIRLKNSKSYKNNNKKSKQHSMLLLLLLVRFPNSKIIFPRLPKKTTQKFTQKNLIKSFYVLHQFIFFETSVTCFFFFIYQFINSQHKISKKKIKNKTIIKSRTQNVRVQPQIPSFHPASSQPQPTSPQNLHVQQTSVQLQPENQRQNSPAKYSTKSNLQNPLFTPYFYDHLTDSKTLLTPQLSSPASLPPKLHNHDDSATFNYELKRFKNPQEQKSRGNRLKGGIHSTPTPTPTLTPVQEETLADIQTEKIPQKVEFKQEKQNQVAKESQYYSQQSEILNVQLREQADVFEQVQKLRESVSESKLRQQKLQQHIQRLQIEVEKNTKADNGSTIKVEALRDPLHAQAVEVVSQTSHTAHDATTAQPDLKQQQQQQQQQLHQKQELIQDQLQQAKQAPVTQPELTGDR